MSRSTIHAIAIDCDDVLVPTASNIFKGGQSNVKFAVALFYRIQRIIPDGVVGRWFNTFRNEPIIVGFFQRLSDRGDVILRLLLVILI